MLNGIVELPSGLSRVISSNITQNNTRVDFHPLKRYPYVQNMVERCVMAHEILSADEAAEYLGLAKVTIYGYARKGIIPSLKLARKWKFHKAALDEWLREQTLKTTEDRAQKAKAL